MRPQQLTLPSRQSLLHGTTENHKPERVQIITIYNCSTKTEMRHTCATRVPHFRLSTTVVDSDNLNSLWFVILRCAMEKRLSGWKRELLRAHGLIADLFVRSEPRARSFAYLQGLLSGCERKNGWQLAEWMEEVAPYRAQHPLDTSGA